jgi:peptide/nickel transport system substrate-binding protein
LKKKAAGALGVLLSTSALLLGTVSTAPAWASVRSASTTGRTLVIDNSFVLVTADPGHEYEPTGNLVDYALYDSLLTFKGGNLKSVVPDLATSYQVSDSARKYVFHLNPHARFSDGTPVTSADVVWSLNRMINLKGNPAFMLAGENITADGPETVVMTSSAPNPGIPYIVTNPACGILNEKVVAAHGGTDAANASTKDTAEDWLDANSAGSGPYILKSFSTVSQVVLTANPNYWGPKPAYSTVVLRNTATAAIERLDVQRGTNEIALDLDPSQSQGMTNVQIHASPSPNVLFLLTNDNPKVSKITSNPDFQKAIRYGVDYAGLLELAGAGAVQSPGVVPTVLLGALPKNADPKYDLSQAKSWLAKSGLGHPSLKLTYPTGITVNGLTFDDAAARLQQYLDQIGINVTLQPQSIQVALQTYRDGTEPLGLWYWGPDYPDPEDYLAFAPGHLVGLRAGWTTAEAQANAPSVNSLTNLAATTAAVSDRQAVFEKFQTALNKYGPFIPLVQPAEVIVGTKNIKNLQANGLWLVDLRNLG